MATHDYVLANASGAAFRADLNNALAAIVSNNSNATEPATTYAYMWWMDTTNGQLKQRNAANDGWITIREIDGTMLMEDGTVGAPGLAFASDLDTGFFRPGANQLAVATNGIQRINIEADGDINIDSGGVFYDATNNRLAIGTTSPAATLHSRTDSAGSGSTPLLIQNRSISANTAVGISFAPNTSDTADRSAIIYGVNSSGGSGNATDLTFHTNANNASPTERARIDSSGRLLVGTPTASVDTNFQVTQQTNVDWCATLEHTTTDATPLGLRIKYTASAPNNAGAVFLFAGDNTATRFEMRSNGGLANYSANNANLSDINSKKDISPAAGTWDCIKEWEIVNYRYKDQPDDANLNLGVIAQQVAESCPEVITVFQEAKEATETEPAQEKRLGVKEQQMYWMAIKALQEAMERIEQLEAEMAEVKAQLS